MTVQRFEMAALHGSSIHATLTGVLIQYSSEKRDEISKWLHQLADTFDNQPTGGFEGYVACPMCNGKPDLSGGFYHLCPLCKGSLRVSPQIAMEYLANATQAQPARVTQSQPDTQNVQFGPVYNPALAGKGPESADVGVQYGPVYDPALAGRGPESSSN